MSNDQQFAGDQRPVTNDQFVIFRVAATSYALPITTVREIVRVPEITAVPQSPDFLAGVINLRGRIVPVIDLRKRLHQPAPNDPRPAATSRILVLARDEKLVGMLVDSASEVARIDPAQIEASPKLFGDLSDAYVAAIARHQGRLLVLLDVNTLLPDTGTHPSADPGVVEGSPAPRPLQSVRRTPDTGIRP